jgi:hypothetical protein
MSLAPRPARRVCIIARSMPPKSVPRSCYGTYAQEADGSYIYNTPAYTYTDATSSVPIAAHIATSKTDPTVATSQ